MIHFQDMDRSDQMFLLGSILAPLLFWWYFQGSRKYSTKGMH